MQVLFVIEIFLRFITGQEPPAAISIKIRLLSIHVANLATINRDRICRKTASSRNELLDSIGSQTELLLRHVVSLVWDTRFRSAIECCPPYSSPTCPRRYS